MVKTNPYFWDCDCEKEYIHRKENTIHCADCGAYAGDRPDSIQSEVLEHYQHAHIRQRWEAYPWAITKNA